MLIMLNDPLPLPLTLPIDTTNYPDFLLCGDEQLIALVDGSQWSRVELCWFSRYHIDIILIVEVIAKMDFDISQFI
jgi:hypothetical protein